MDSRPKRRNKAMFSHFSCVARTLPQVEQVQRRASRWIPRTRRGEMPYKERLIMLDLLPLSVDRELTNLVFFIIAFIVVLI